MSEALLAAVRALRVADPELGLKPMLAKLREQQPNLGAATREVREALIALKAEESEAAKAAAAQPAADEGVPPAVDEGVPAAADESGAPPDVAISLACVGCGRLPSEMDDEREKHPVCHKCRRLKLPTTYWCCVNCPGNPKASQLHVAYHKEEKRQRKHREDGGVLQQQNREAAEEAARRAAQTGDKFLELMAEAARYRSQQDWRRAARAYREAIALRPNKPAAYFNLGNALNASGHYVEAAQRFLEAKQRETVGSEYWAQSTALVFSMLTQEQCSEVAKPEWWNDEELKALSARVVRAAPNEVGTISMRAIVLHGQSGTWEAGPRSVAELREAAAYFERAAALSNAPVMKAEFASCADACRSLAEAITENALNFARYNPLEPVAGQMSETLLLLAAVRALRVADPDLGPKPLLAKLREQQPELGAATREVREALVALKAESEAAKAAAAQPAADEGVPPAVDEG
eukprot:scaffold90855_cov69-Phaeocystis_antarctica.AAC.7